MNYAEIVQAIEDETENTDTTFIANIPIIVENAEKRIYQAVKIPDLRKNQVGNFTANNPYLTLPDDYLSTWEIAAIDLSTIYYYLLPKDVSYIREAYPSPYTGAVPKFYAQFDAGTLIVGPTPDQSYQVEIHYFYYPETIVTASTSWLGDNFPNTLLYGALVEAAVFMKSDEDTMKQYAEQYAVNMGLLKQYAEGSIRSGDYRR